MVPCRSSAMAPLRITRRPLRRTVLLSMVLLFLCLPPAADALHCHRRHRSRHRHGHHAADSAHISQPPAVPLPPEAGGYSPAFPPDLDDHTPAPAPSPNSSRDKLCNPPFSRAPVGVPARSPSASAAKQPSFPPAKPSSTSPSPAKAPSHSRSKPPSVHVVKPPAFPPAEPPPLAAAKPPSATPVTAPPPSLPLTKAPPSSSSPSKPPSASFSHSKPPPCTPAMPQPQAEPPRPSPATDKPPPTPSPSQPPRLSPANPPAMAPTPSPAKPPLLAPVKPPVHPPVKTPTPAQPPVLSPAKPPAHAQAHQAIPPIAAPPPSLPPAAPSAKKNSSAANTSVFDVTAFGASGNGSSAEDTSAFRAAWKAACSADAESATLLVPPDGIFTITSSIFSGPCKPRLTFQIDGVVMPPDGPASWSETDSRRQWMVFYRADGMTLTGRGTIEGNGEEWWNLPCKPHRGPNGSTLPEPCDSPTLIRFMASSDVTVEGLRMENSPQFHLRFDGCGRVRIDGLVVSSPAFSPNTDGVHVENTTSVQILNSRISNGDDCVSIGAGCSHVHVENVTCGHGHGISIGSLGVRNTHACVSNVTVRNARIVDSDNGVRIKTWQGGAGSVSGVEFAGVRMENVRTCIVIDQYYCLAPRGGGGCANQTSAVRVAGVAYRDIRGTYAGAAPVRFACSDTVACTDITMADVELRPAGAGAGAAARLADPYCWNAYGVTETPTLPPVYCLQDGRPELLQDQLSSC